VAKKVPPGQQLLVFRERIQSSSGQGFRGG
jgi:hypothetical protein